MVVFAVMLAYALFEIPGGYLGDWIDTRRVLLRIVPWWNFDTAASGWARNLISRMITRCLFLGLLGLVWAVVFTWWYRDDARTHPGVNAAEAALLPPSPPPGGDKLHTPWRQMATSRTLWCLCSQYARLSCAWYFSVTWFPTYLLDAWKFDLKSSAALAGTMGMAGQFGGVISPIVLGMIVSRTGNWPCTFHVTAVACAVCWLFIDPIAFLDEHLSHDG